MTGEEYVNALTAASDEIQDLEMDHEKFVGEVIPDPWADDTQTDWGSAAPILDAGDDGEDDEVGDDVLTGNEEESK